QIPCLVILPLPAVWVDPKLKMPILLLSFPLPPVPVNMMLPSPVAAITPSKPLKIPILEEAVPVPPGPLIVIPPVPPVSTVEPEIQTPLFDPEDHPVPLSVIVPPVLLGPLAS